MLHIYHERWSIGTDGESESNELMMMMIFNLKYTSHHLSFLSRHPSLSAIAPGKSSRRHSTSAQNWWLCFYLFVYAQKSTGEFQLWILPYISRSTQYVFLGWFARWEISGRTIAVFLGAASSICSKQQVESLCSSHQAFFQVFYFHWEIRYPYRGARGVTVIVVGNGHGNTDSNPGRDWLDST